MSESNNSENSRSDHAQIGRFWRMLTVIWTGLACTTYWLAGFDFERSPALGSLFVVLIAGAIGGYFLATFLVVFRRQHPEYFED